VIDLEGARDWGLGARNLGLDNADVSRMKQEEKVSDC
jgi:hypothetical protein